MSETILVDLMNMAFRMFYRTDLRSTQGVATGVTHGCLVSILKLAKEYPRSSIVVCVDGPHSWRRTMNQEYKAQRQSNEVAVVRFKTEKKNVVNKDTQKTERVEETVEVKEVLDRNEIYHQVDSVIRILNVVGIRTIRINTLEADDLIGILSKKLRVDRVLIFSNDKDFYQLVEDPHVAVIRPLPHGNKFIKEKHVVEEFGVKPKKLSLLRALSGDASDNIKAVKGIGPKIAYKYIQAGINPSLKLFSMHHYSIQRDHMVLKDEWSRIHMAWQMTVIPREVNYPLFPEQIKEELEDAVYDIVESKGTRRKVDIEAASYKVLKIASELELDQIISRRNEFFRVR